MKTLKMILVVALMMFFTGTAFAYEVSFNFGWKANTETTMKQYVIYHRIQDQGYNYEIPIRVIPCTMSDGKCVTEKTVDGDNHTTNPVILNVPDGQKTTLYFVMRAESTEEEQSGDSNEVFAETNLTPLLVASDFTAVFNKVAQTIDFTWTQPSLDRVNKWQLYSSDTSGTGFVAVGDTIPYDGNSTTITSSIPADTVAPGTRTFFTVVAFADYGIFSQNSNEIVIDRRPPAKVILKIHLIK